jgi:hypothetical protein
VAETEGTSELISQASEQISTLVRAEMRLALAEMKDKGRNAGVGAGLFGGAGLVALYGTAALIVAVTAALDLALPLWAAALIVGAVLLAVAGVLGLIGRRRFDQAVPPVPAQAIQSIEKDITEIKERAHR